MSARQQPGPPPGRASEAALWARIVAEARPDLDAFLRLHGIPPHPTEPVLLPGPVAPDDDGWLLLSYILTRAADRIAAADQATADGEGSAP